MVISAVLIGVLAPLAQAADPNDAIRFAIKRSFPEARVEDVRPSPIPGLYEVFTGNQLIYSDPTGAHLFVGQLLDTNTKRDLAEEELQARLRIDFNTLPFDRAIRIVKGTGAARLAIFEDPDCPYCQQLEKSLLGIDDLTLYVFLYPLADLHPQARERSHAIWCSADPAAAWTQWMRERKAPEAAPVGCHSDPVEALGVLAGKLFVDSTPTLFFADGLRAKGAIQPEQLKTMLRKHVVDVHEALPAANAPVEGARATAVSRVTESAPRE